MKSVWLLSVFFFLFSGASLQSQETRMYRLQLKEKGNTPFSTAHPEAFLSSESIERRLRQNLPIDSLDLPLDPAYLEAVAETGATIRSTGKWLKTVVVSVNDTLTILPRLKNLSFVDSIYCVWEGTLPDASDASADTSLQTAFRQSMINSYGAGFAQIALENGHLLQNAGFRGKGMTIAVIDGGFTNADKTDFFNPEHIKGIKNFNHETTDMLREGTDHGTRVLSCMLSDKSGEMTGTAPDADYYLFRTEVTDNEFPVEEDYWIAALEYADSLGVDIVTSSVGYSTFDDPTMNHTKAQLDGKSVLISRAAGFAASRGILLFNSAGNEGSNNWKKIIFPADAENIITVGSVTNDSIRSSFSSVGFTVDNRIKPDLVAQGTSISVVTSSDTIIQANGTSFSTPIMAGLAACLWEACPDLNSFAMLKLLRESGNRFQNPDSLTGYGIADVYKAYIQQKTDIRPIILSSDPIYISINPIDNRLYVNLTGSEQYGKCLLNIYTTLGNRILTVYGLSGPVDISPLPKGVYIVSLRIGDKRFVRKFIKS